MRSSIIYRRVLAGGTRNELEEFILGHPIVIVRGDGHLARFASLLDLFGTDCLWLLAADPSAPTSQLL